MTPPPTSPPTRLSSPIILTINRTLEHSISELTSHMSLLQETQDAQARERQASRDTQQRIIDQLVARVAELEMMALRQRCEILVSREWNRRLVLRAWALMGLMGLVVLVGFLCVGFMWMDQERHRG